MENLEVRPKNFIIKWINAPDNSKIKWEVKPLKKSINFGIYISNSQTELEMGEVHEFNRERSNSVSTLSSNSNLEQRLGSKLKKVQWVGRCNGNELISGTVKVDQGNLYAFVFDNTFSKTVGKKIMFNQYIEEERKQSVSEPASASPTQTIDLPPATPNVKFELPTKGLAGPNSSFLTVKGGKYLQGMLLKKKRKRSTKNFSQRFFVLNFKYGILNYYVNERSNHVRGNMYIKNVVISADKPSLTIYLDSGLELWVLKALNEDDWSVWIKAFNFIKKKNRDYVNGSTGVVGGEFDEDEMLEKIEKLKQLASGLINNLEKRKPSFWRRYSKSNSTTNLNSPKESSDDAASISTSSKTNSVDASVLAKNILAGLLELESMIDSPKLSRTATTATSLFSQEFYDAEEYFHEVGDKVVMLKDGSEENGVNNESSDNLNMNFDVSSSESSDMDSFTPLKSPIKASPSDLYPLPQPPVSRRMDINPSTCDPPSWIAFIRKNLGKDLSTIAMPVTSNEPLTFLQKYAESYEYTNLIDEALKSDVASGERILKIAAFAVTSLSPFRAKERNIRKAFNPLLGETFELVREDKGFRLIVEKVEHRPFVMAAHADSADWTIDHCPTPSQSIRGKSMEVSVKGTITLTVRSTGEVYQWVQPTTLLKNLIAGEKYSEPASSLTITSSTGHRAVVSFKVSGMFSGRSETLSIKAMDKTNNYLPLEIRGSWTEKLNFFNGDEEGDQVWKAGNLVPQYQKKFGFTEFAASLNQITALEKGKLAPTDSRLRPDQRAYENGDVDEAEQLKLSLEESQRMRRKQNEDTNKTHETKFFKLMLGSQDPGNDGKPYWSYIDGENSYWNRRKRGDWGDLLRLW